MTATTTSLRRSGDAGFTADPRVACRTSGVDPNVFFPPRGQADVLAKAICAACPLLVECREYAVSIPDLAGIWGGTSQRERDRLRAQRAGETRQPR